MTTNLHDQYVTRESIMKLLSNDEVAKVSTAETTPKLQAGDEYIDLEHVGAGVKHAAVGTNMDSVLPRKAVHSGTWTKILAHLAAAPKTN